MLIGLLAPTAGTIEVDGIDVIRQPRRVRDRIGYMGQKVSLYQGLTLRENVEFYAGLYGLDGAALERALGRGARALRSRRRRGRAAREPAGRPAPARRPRARHAARAAAALPRRADRGRRRREPRPLLGAHPGRGRRGRDGVRHHALPRGGRTTATGSRFIDAGRLIANATPEELRAATRTATGSTSTRRSARASAARRARAPRASPATRERTTRCAARGRSSTPRRSTRSPRRSVPRRSAGVRIEQPPMNDVFRACSQAPRRRRGAMNGPRGSRTLVVREVRATLRDPFTVGDADRRAARRAARLRRRCSRPRSQGMRARRPRREPHARRAGAWSPSSRPAAPSSRARTRRARRSKRALVAGEISAALVHPAGLRPDALARRRGRRAARGAGALRRRRDRARRQRRGLPALDRRGERRAHRWCAICAGARTRPPPSVGGVDVVTRALFNPQLSTAGRSWWPAPSASCSRSSPR